MPGSDHSEFSNHSAFQKTEAQKQAEEEALAKARAVEPNDDMDVEQVRKLLAQAMEEMRADEP